LEQCSLAYGCEHLFIIISPKFCQQFGSAFQPGVPRGHMLCAVTSDVINKLVMVSFSVDTL